VKTRLQPGAKQILNWDWMKKIELRVDEIEMNRSKKKLSKNCFQILLRVVLPASPVLKICVHPRQNRGAHNFEMPRSKGINYKVTPEEKK
jgi:hypothetical protein